MGINAKWFNRVPTAFKMTCGDALLVVSFYSNAQLEGYVGDAPLTQFSNVGDASLKYSHLVGDVSPTLR